MKIQAVLLDLDNTLYGYDAPDTAAMGVVYSRIQSRSRLGVRKLAALYREAHRHFAHALAHRAGRHNRLHIFARMVESSLGRPDPAWALRLHEAYWKKFLSVMKPHTDAHRLLATLAGRYKLALVTNQTTEAQYRKVAALGFAKYFDAIVTSESAGVEKPDAKIFRLALESLGVEAKHAVMVGDTIKGDIAGAQAAGIVAIQMVEFAREKHEKIRPDHTVKRLGLLPAMLEKLESQGHQEK